MQGNSCGVALPRMSQTCDAPKVFRKFGTELWYNKNTTSDSYLRICPTRRLESRLRDGTQMTQMYADERRYSKNNKISVHQRLSRLFAFLVLILLALQGRHLAARFLTNLATLALLPRWQAAAQSPALPTCPEGSASSPAALWLDAALRLAPQDGRAWLQKGRALWLEGRCPEAVEAWQRAVARNPHDAAAWLLLLQAAPETDLRPDPAIAQGITNYALSRGDQARAAGEWEQALDWYDRAFVLLPNRAAAARLEAVYLQLERKAEAIARWEALADLLPDTDPDHWWARGRAAELAENWEAAAQAYGEGARRSAQPYDFWMRQGAAWERLKDWARATLGGPARTTPPRWSGTGGRRRWPRSGWTLNTTSATRTISSRTTGRRRGISGRRWRSTPGIPGAPTGWRRASISRGNGRRPSAGCARR